MLHKLRCQQRAPAFTFAALERTAAVHLCWPEHRADSCFHDDLCHFIGSLIDVVARLSVLRPPHVFLKDRQVFILKHPTRGFLMFHSAGGKLGLDATWFHCGEMNAKI